MNNCAKYQHQKQKLHFYIFEGLKNGPFKENFDTFFYDFYDLEPR